MRGFQDDARKEEIYNCATQLFIERGYEEVTMKEIAEEANLSEKQFVGMFKSKGDFVIELMIEGFSLEEEDAQELEQIDLNMAVADIVYDYIMKRLDRYMVFGKKMFKEMMSWSLSLMKKKPGLMNKFVQMDFMFVDDLIAFLDDLKDKGCLEEEFDSVQAGEIIYSVLAFEFLVYIYQPNHSREQLNNGIRKKLQFVLT
ncbi:TetR/AcrR family transcriptional regulator [Pontibacillus sp. ALD_SL1]|uniref:TetR/AcrR family transcriptional regulator n=1 Tax=Pontibacillus sp. ALD_SL1 TaxID=2777185 RepID=UPI001A958CF8|nr:TetR/AcrR family transcriptional regulator [Pontibacillus sp. ALD_SL1]QST00541.1 TetR/AcrR family transcriptional regulator [Pontibacillus sp. ALD_SL1]